MKKQTLFSILIVAACIVSLPAQQSPGSTYKPKRINKAIELLEQGQPIYYTGVNGGGYQEGKALAQTWADYISYNMEHSSFNISELRAFMRGPVRDE